MHIEHVEIGNFRKLQGVRIDFAEKTTVFVGANNSGKTSAMEALRTFLVNRKDFSPHDFTLSHWGTLDALGTAWEAETGAGSQLAFEWDAVLPHLDVWLAVSSADLHHVQKILSTIDWRGERIGVRLRFEPKDIEALKREYLAARGAAVAVMGASSGTTELGRTVSESGEPFALWPRSMMDFLSRRLRAVFEVQAYLLDPSKLIPPKDGRAVPQPLPIDSEPVEGDPFAGLIRVDEISAQRGLGVDPGWRDQGERDEGLVRGGGRKLSSQLRSYYTQHLDPLDQPDPSDVEALRALHQAQAAFGTRLSMCFSVALKELAEIGYPGVTDPKLTIATDIKPIDGLSHASAVQYEVPTRLDSGGAAHRLPEHSNGLGYQNLVSIVFALMSFRDKWMRVGKAAKSSEFSETLVPPLHLVLIEEPEAHLHAQVQQVFIRQAYEILRKHDQLRESKDLSTQLIVSTHSSHIAHEAEFEALRYFRRLPLPSMPGAVPVSSVVNLSEVFGTQDETERFVKRYLKATHCDLFFADGAVLVEGPAERILVPHFVRKRSDYEHLQRCYITWLEIGGSHAHRLKSLLQHLGLNTLIITDIDAKDAEGKSVHPVRGAGLTSRNETLKSWIPGTQDFDELLDKQPGALATVDSDGFSIRAAYQQPIRAKFKSDELKEALANTFEDALLLENVDIFSSLVGGGLIGRFRKALLESSDLSMLAVRCAEALVKGGKAEFAMELLYRDEVDLLKVPAYIHKGLGWLADQLRRNEIEVVGNRGGVPSAPVDDSSAAPAIDNVGVGVPP